MELFDTGRKDQADKPPKKAPPTPPQLRLLHVLAKGTLTVNTFPFTTYSVIFENQNLSWRFHPNVINRVILKGYAEMKIFSRRASEYRITTEGRDALKDFCQHKHVSDESTEVLAGTLICKRCARALRCRSKQPTKHPADRWNWNYGAICQKCTDFLNSQP